MPFVDNNGVKIHYFSQGTGIPLVFLNGYDTTIETVLKYGKEEIDAYSEKYQFIMLDRRGLGQSDKPLDPEYYTPNKNVSDVIAVMNALAIEKAHLWGYSHGGRIAMALARDHSNRFHSFIVGGMHPQAPTVVEKEEIRGDLHMLLEGRDALRKRIFGDRSLSASEQRFIDTFELDVNSAYLQGFDLENWEEPRWLFDLEHPFLFYAGEEDPMVRNEVKEEFLRYRKQAEFTQKMKHAKAVVVPNCGHNIPGRDTPEGKFMDDTIFEFLDRVNQTIK